MPYLFVIKGSVTNDSYSHLPPTPPFLFQELNDRCVPILAKIARMLNGRFGV